MLREQFIAAIQEEFGKRLVCKPNKSMDSYYLAKVRRGNGVFWIDHDESATDLGTVLIFFLNNG